MIRHLLILAALMLSAPAAAQTVTGCGTVAISKSESIDRDKLGVGADCFGKAKIIAASAETARRDKLAMLPLLDSKIAGTVPIVTSGIDVAKWLYAKPVPATAKPDVLGAFRFVCAPGQILPDDPIVYPGQPGKAHLHQFFGNLEASASSTYASLRTSGDSTCTNILNRSAYWMPAMLDGRGNVVRPDLIGIYYKRRPESDPECQKMAKACVILPRGLRYIFGWDQFRPNDPQPENAKHIVWKCYSNNRLVGEQASDLTEVAKICKPGMQLMVQSASSGCWDGKNLDSPDHRSHMADATYGNWGYLKCPASHPLVIAQFTILPTWTIQPGDDPTQWHLSSDHMKPGGAPGSTFHADWFGAWDDGALQRWHDNCLNKLLTCVDGDLGDGHIMTRNSLYPSGSAKPRLVPISGPIGL